jgi:hypothetical protein
MFGAHRDGMPIVARQPGLRPTAAPRSGGRASVGGSAPSEDLLPSGGATAAARAPAPHRALALDALSLLRYLRDRPRDADVLREPAFAREVELVRWQLAPIRTRRSLAASFGREAYLRQTPGDPADGPGIRPIRAAYAVRWLELGDRVARPGWTELVTDPA